MRSRSSRRYACAGAYAEYLPAPSNVNAGPSIALGRVAVTKQVVHIADMQAEPSYLSETRRVAMSTGRCSDALSSRCSRRTS